MPKILVVYDSKSGSTETMALAVTRGAKKQVTWKSRLKGLSKQQTVTFLLPTA